MRRLIPLVLLLTCALAATARAAGPEVGIADDRVLLLGAGPDADRAVRAWKADGVDIVRILATWRTIAPAADALDPPEGFVADDPNDPHYDWRRLDDAVNRVRFAGMKVMLTVTGPGPLWSSRSPSAGNFRSKPDAGEVRRLRHRRRQALRRSGGPLHPLERAQPVAVAPAAVVLREGPAARRSRRTCTATSCAPPTRRSAPRTRAPRS